MSNPPRIWMSTQTPAKGEIVRFRAQIRHVMETGFRLDANGQTIAQDTLGLFQARFNGALFMEWLPETAISPNPYLEFTLRAQESGTVEMIWTDTKGLVAEATREITLA